MIKLKIQGAEKVAKSLLRPNIPQILDHRLGLIAEHIRQQVSQAAPRKTGKLGSSIVRRHPTSLVWHIVETAEHGLWIRKGTHPHIIKPKRKRALMWAGLSHPISVAHHGGIKKVSRYHVTGLKNAESEIKRLAADLGQDVKIQIEK